MCCAAQICPAAISRGGRRVVVAVAGLAVATAAPALAAPGAPVTTARAAPSPCSSSSTPRPGATSRPRTRWPPPRSGRRELTGTAPADRRPAGAPTGGARRDRPAVVPDRPARADERAAHRRTRPAASWTGPRPCRRSRSQQDAALRDLKATRDGQAQAKLAIDAAVRDQQKQVNLMARRKAQAEAALKAADAGQDAPQPGDGGSSAKATSAPRNSDGSLPAEGCTVQRPDHQRLHHPAHAARPAAGQGGRVHALRRVLPPAGQRRASQGPGLRLRRRQGRLRRGRDAAPARTTATGWPTTSSTTPTGWACSTSSGSDGSGCPAAAGRRTPGATATRRATTPTTYISRCARSVRECRARYLFM